MSDLKIKGGVVVTGSTATFPASTTIGGAQASTTTGIETLTNKTLTSPAINTPTGLVKGDVGLGNVDNTSDVNKPISSATSTALSGKEATITATTSADYYRGDKSFQPLNKAAVGLGNVDNTSDANKPVSTATQTALNLKIDSTLIGANSGVASLDAGGKVPVAQLPNSVMTFEGVWDASTNTPTLADATGNAGMVYLVSVAGTQNLGSGAQTFAVGDWVVANSTVVWQKSTNSNSVVSVNGQTGVVTLTKTDVSLGNVDNTSDATKNSAIATLTNKTIDAVSNTISNIANTNVAAAAGIVESKLTLDFSTSSLNTAVGTKVTANTAIVAGTNTKITYDAKGLVTAGAAATTADIAASTNKNYVTDAQAIVIGNTSGTNTGDQTATTVPNTPAGTITTSTVQAAINELDTLKAPKASPTFTGTVSGITSTMVGLGNVTNDAQLKSVDLDNDTALTANSATKIPTQHAVKTYVDNAATLPTGDINPTSFTAAGSVAVAANVTGLAFANASITGFRALVTVKNVTSALYEIFTLEGIQKGALWDMSVTSTGDNSLVAFTITTAGQVQYTNADVNGATLRFRAQSL
jgi:hypothetical protein